MKKRLDSLRIERFREVRELSISELGHVNLIVGGNNSGKSSVLEALRFFAGRAAPTLLEELLSLRGEFQVVQQRKESSVLTRGSAEALRYLFVGRSFPAEDGAAIHVGSTSGDQFVRLEHVYHLGVDPESRSSAHPRWKMAFKKDDPGLWAMEAVEIRSSARSDPWIADLEDLFDDRPRGSRYERQVAKLPSSYVLPGFPLSPRLAEAWDDIVLTPGEQIALNALRIIEPQTEGLAFIHKESPSTVRNDAVRSLSEERVAVLKLKSVSSPMPLSSMGDGMSRVLYLVLAALQAQDGFLLIDAFENGLHHSVQSKVWEVLFSLARSQGVQIFATTHSNDCVRAFSQVALANREVDGKLLKLERMPDDGRTVAAVVGEDDLSNLLDAGIEVRG